MAAAVLRGAPASTAALTAAATSTGPLPGAGESPFEGPIRAIVWSAQGDQHTSTLQSLGLAAKMKTHGNFYVTAPGREIQ